MLSLMGPVQPGPPANPQSMTHINGAAVAVLQGRNGEREPEAGDQIRLFALLNRANRKLHNL